MTPPCCGQPLPSPAVVSLVGFAGAQHLKLGATACPSCGSLWVVAYGSMVDWRRVGPPGKRPLLDGGPALRRERPRKARPGRLRAGGVLEVVVFWGCLLAVLGALWGLHLLR